MVASEFPLLKGKVLEISELNSYKELLVIEADPQRVLYIAHIRITVDDTTSKPQVKVSLDGVKYLEDFLMLSSPLTIDFGKSLRLLSNRKKPIEIYLKKTAAGLGDLTVTAFVDGIEVRKT